jgi:hypothetical protein
LAVAAVAGETPTRAEPTRVATTTAAPVTAARVAGALTGHPRRAPDGAAPVRR